MSYPKEIMDAIGGEEILKELKETPIKPSYSPNIVYETDWSNVTFPYVMKGKDKEERPFLIVCLPKLSPLVLHTYSNCGSDTEYKDLNNWVVGGDAFSRVLYEQDPVYGLLSDLCQGKERDYRSVYDTIRLWNYIKPREVIFFPNL